MSEFTLSLSRFAAKVGTRADQVVRKLALDMFKSIVLRTPVSTGRLRGAWSVSIGLAGMPNNELELNDKTGTATISRGAAQILGVQAGQKIVFSNVMPYARAIEFGHSKQSPAGMVRITLRETERFLREATRG